MTSRSAKQGKTRSAAAVSVPVDEGPGAALDRYDVAILAEMQADARLSNAEIGRAHV